MLTAVLVLPVIVSVFDQYTIFELDLIDCEAKKEANESPMHEACIDR